MKRLYAVIELDDTSAFDPSCDHHMDELAEDLLTVTHKVTAVTVYPTAEQLIADEG